MASLSPEQMEILYLILWLVGSGAAAIVLMVFWRRVLIPLTHRTRTRFDAKLVESMDGPIQWTLLAAGVYAGASFAFQDAAGTEMARIHDSQFWRLCVGVFYVNLIFAVTMLIYSVCRGVVDWYTEGFAERTHAPLDSNVIIFFQRFAKVLFFFIALTVVFQHFDVQITGILATAGIASLAFAFAAQDTLANLISGVILVFDRPFKCGDRITLSSGDWGDVLDIGLRSTKVLSFDQTVIVIPNAEIAKGQIINQSAPDSKVKVRHNLGVAYGSDMHKVKRIIKSILHEDRDVLDEPAPDVFFMEFGESSLNLMIAFWISDCRQRYRVLDDVNMAIKDRFEAEGVEIPFPQRDIHIRSTVTREGTV